MKLHELWRLQYRQRRYLEHATQEELNQRIDDLLCNVVFFNAEGKIGMKNPLEEGDWIVLFTHVLEELELRGKAIEPDMVAASDFLKKRYHRVKQAAEIWNGRKLKPGSYLAKFGKAEHIVPMFEQGLLRVSPASYYRHQFHNASIRDNELEYTEEFYGAKIHVIEGGKRVEMPIIGNVKMKLTADADYYVSCYTLAYEYRLFDDFDADACFIITRPNGFLNRLAEAFGEVLPGWKCTKGKTIYRDPYHPIEENSICYSKHMRYAYQHEYRMCWQPPVPTENLNHVHLDLGRLTEFGELLRL